MEPVARPWRIELFGGLQILQEGGKPVQLLPQQPNALLAYLALHLQRSHTREELIERLWPEEQAGDVQKKMRNSLHLLRQRFEQPPLDQAHLLRITRQTIGLDPNFVSTDVQEFKDALSAAAATTDREARQQYLAQAARLYRGDLLPGFYQDCFVSERNRLSDLYASALHLLTQVYEQSGDLEKAVESARRVVALDPLMEEAHCTLMRLFAEMGQPSAVLRQYQELERVLKEEYGETPSAATRQLMETLRERAQANVPHTVNGKPEPISPTPAEAPDASHTASLPAFPETFPESVFASHPVRSTPTPARRPLLLGAVVVVTLMVALSSSFLHRRAMLPKSGLLVPNAQRLWVVREKPALDEKPNSQPTAMTTDAIGNIYITGFVQTLKHDVDYLTLKYDPNGKLLWRRRYNGPGNDVDRARSIAVDKDGNVYVTGESDNGKGNGLTRLSGLDWATIKYDKNGIQQWVARYNGPDDGADRPSKLCVDAVGNVYVAGYSHAKRRYKGQTGANPEWALVKYDAMGKQVWARREDTPEWGLATSAEDMAVDPSGNIYVTGYANIDRQGVKQTGLTIKYDSNGVPLWSQTYGGTGVGKIYFGRIALDSSGNVYILGHQDGGDLMNNGTLTDFVTLKYDSEGNQKWVRVYDNAHKNDLQTALAVDAAGNVCVTGYSGPDDSRDYLSVRYDANGILQWARTYNGTANAADEAYGVAFDHTGNVLVTGHATDAYRRQSIGTAPELYRREDNVTIKYDPTGRPLWKGVYEGGIRWGPDPCMVAIDSQNNVIVTGQSDGGNNTPVITTFKYAPDPSP